MTTLTPSGTRRDGSSSANRSSIGLSNWLTPMVFSNLFGNKSTQSSLNQPEYDHSDVETDTFSPPSTKEDESETRRSSLSKSLPGDEATRSRSRKPSVPKIKYSIAQPPPISARRRVLHTKPKLALQFQKLNPPSRPRPAFDVVPFSALEGKSGRRLPPAFKRRYPCTGSVFAIVKANSYNAAACDPADVHTVEPEKESWEPSRAVGVVSIHGDDEETEITLIDGTTWIASWLSNGNCEFKCDDGLGQPCTVRWIARLSNGEARYKFTAIDPKSRKHPILASLGRSELSIHENYKVPPSPAASTQTSPGVNQTLDNPFFLASSSPTSHYSPATTLHATRGGDEFLRTTTEQMQLLIVVTAVCVAFKEGWSIAFGSDRYQKDISSDSSHFTSVPVRQTSPGRSSSPPKVRKASLPTRVPTLGTINKRGVHKPTRSVTLTSAFSHPDTSPVPTRSNSTGGDRGRRKDETRRASLHWPTKRQSQLQVQEMFLGESETGSEPGGISRAHPPSSYISKQPIQPQPTASHEHPAHTEGNGSSSPAKAGGDVETEGNTLSLENNVTKEQGRAARFTEGMKRLMRRTSIRT